MRVLRPRASSRVPIEAAARPFPREETTPPVTKIYFIMTVVFLRVSGGEEEVLELVGLGAGVYAGRGVIGLQDFDCGAIFEGPELLEGFCELEG